MPTPIINIYQPNQGDSLEKKVKDLTNAFVDVMQYLKYLLEKLDSKNVKKITTEFTKISSDGYETEFSGPLLMMKDKQVVPIVRLQMGYDPVSQRFTFKLRDTGGNETLTLSDLGQILLSGKPLFEMYDADDVLRLKMGYDAATGDFVFELYNAAGDTTVGIDDSGNGTFTGSITGSTITGGTIKTAAAGNDRIELTGSGLVSYNESNQKEGVAIESGLYGFSKLALYVAGTEKGGLSAGAIDKLELETAAGIDLIINPSNGSSNRITETWDCSMAVFTHLSDGTSAYATKAYAAEKGANTGSDSHTHTVTIGGVTYTTSSESHSHTQT
jgi:hypothetical protein